MALEARSEDAEACLPALRWVPVDTIDLSALSSSVKKVYALAAGLGAAPKRRLLTLAVARKRSDKA